MIRIRETILAALPMTILALVLLTYSSSSYFKDHREAISFYFEQPSGGKGTDSAVSITGSEDTCECELKKDATCSNTENPVLGGVDVMQYFTSFQLDDGTYNESAIGEIGNRQYSSTYKGYSFWFLSQENKEMFDESPSSYVPQYGGFCSWGVAGEYCPQYAWSATCLGPAGNWGHWTIYESKLYFFLFEKAKGKFVDDLAGYSEAGEERWLSWFPEEDYFNTNCYVSDTSRG
jgi:YHS domain-containing protein